MNPVEAAQRITSALENGEDVRLVGKGFDANLGGNTLIFRIGEERIEFSAMYLDDSFVEDMDLAEDEDES